MLFRSVPVSRRTVSLLDIGSGRYPVDEHSLELFSGTKVSARAWGKVVHRRDGTTFSTQYVAIEVTIETARQTRRTEIAASEFPNWPPRSRLKCECLTSVASIS